MYIKKVKGEPSLSNELESFMESSGGIDMPGIVQRFILDRSDTAYFMQDITMASLEAYPCKITDIQSGAATCLG